MRRRGKRAAELANMAADAVQPDVESFYARLAELQRASFKKESAELEALGFSPRHNIDEWRSYTICLRCGAMVRLGFRDGGAGEGYAQERWLRLHIAHHEGGA